MFSILIATWNNLDYLKLCIDSIKKHTQVEHEIVIHVNDGADGTVDWVRSQNIKHSRSSRNIGVCLSYNHLAARAQGEWLVLLNDDMVCCPGWDTAYAEAIRSAPSTLALYSSTLIEPRAANNDLVIVADYGRTPADFREKDLLANYRAVSRNDVLGRMSQPTVIHRDWWHLVGGYSIEFGPGMSSDNDLWMKMWAVGCRHFRVLGNSRVYHFSQASTGKVRRNRGGAAFALKWGITQREFMTDYLAKSASAAEAGTMPLPRASLKGRIKRIEYACGDHPLGDLAAWEEAPALHLERPRE
jgi:GT2 family glycosyltransferase